MVKDANERADLVCDNIRAHAVHAIESSWAYFIKKKVRLEDIIVAASWSSAGVFQGSYFRDMSAVADQIYTPGPVVAA